MSIASRVRNIMEEAIAVRGLVLRKSRRSNPRTDPSINAADGEPSEVEPNASLRLIGDATDPDRAVAVRVAGVWHFLSAGESGAALKAALLTRETTTVGAKVVLYEGTDNGTNAVTIQGPASLTADRTVSMPDADVNLSPLASTGVLTMLAAADWLVRATVTVANSAQDSALAVQLSRLDGATNVTSARQVWLSTGSQYQLNGPPNASITLGTVTKGSVLAILQAGSLWLIETDATGAFECTATNTDNESTYFAVATAAGGVSDSTKGCVVVASNSDVATWT